MYDIITQANISSAHTSLSWKCFVLAEILTHAKNNSDIAVARLKHCLQSEVF